MIIDVSNPVGIEETKNHKYIPANQSISDYLDAIGHLIGLELQFFSSLIKFVARSISNSNTCTYMCIRIMLLMRSF